jgi:hypothetical protein
MKILLWDGLPVLADAIPEPPPPPALGNMAVEAAQALAAAATGRANSPAGPNGPAHFDVDTAQATVTTCVEGLRTALGMQPQERLRHQSRRRIRLAVTEKHAFGVGRTVRRILPFLTGAALVAVGTAAVPLAINNPLAVAALGVLTATAKDFAAKLMPTDAELQAALNAPRTPEKEPPERTQLAKISAPHLHRACLVLRLWDARLSIGDPATAHAHLHRAQQSLNELEAAVTEAGEPAPGSNLAAQFTQIREQLAWLGPTPPGNDLPSEHLGSTARPLSSITALEQQTARLELSPTPNPALGTLRPRLW